MLDMQCLCKPSENLIDTSEVSLGKKIEGTIFIIGLSAKNAIFHT